MVPHVGRPPVVTCAVLAMAITASLAGCGSSPSTSSRTVTVTVTTPTPTALGSTGANAQGSQEACATTVLEVLGGVAARVYREGISSARTASATHVITTSLPLREAVQGRDAPIAQTAARALLATGQLSSLEVIPAAPLAGGSAAPAPAGQLLARAGAARAVAPLRGTLTGVGGAVIGSYVASVWTDQGLIAETDGIAQGSTVLRAGGRTIAGSPALPPGSLPQQGRITLKGVAYRYVSFPVVAYPSGELREYLLKSVQSTAPLCGASSQDTILNTLSRVASLIYSGETGSRALTQVHRVEHNQALLQAVAARDPAATVVAINHLLNEHIVRLRVSAEGKLLGDVGGPYVLGPVAGTLRLGGRMIGSFVLSIQDDLGYRLLAERLAGLDVLMYRAASKPVMSSLNPAPASVPRSGPFQLRGRTYQAFTLSGEAFPSGPLRITLLVPIPYS